jgi:hypothetical protein
MIKAEARYIYNGGASCKNAPKPNTVENFKLIGSFDAFDTII